MSDEEEPKATKVSLYDKPGTKIAVDDLVIKHLTVERSIPEYTLWVDIRLLLSLICVVLGYFAHFNKIPYPESRKLTYAVCSNVMTFMSWRKQKDVTVVLKGGKEQSISSQNITISTHFDDKVDNLFWFRAQLGSSTDSKLPMVETSVRLSDLVFSDGEVDAAKVNDTVDALLEQLVMSD